MSGDTLNSDRNLSYEPFTKRVRQIFWSIIAVASLGICLYGIAIANYWIRF